MVLPPHIPLENSLPPWIRIFKANTSTSRCTQAAVMAYTIPSSITTCNTTTIDLRSLTTAKRRMKLDLYMAKVSVPHCFTTLASKYADELNNNIALVCDAGIDNCIPLSPPPSKVNPLITVITKYFHRHLTSMFPLNCYSEKE